jgi:hypothetical protein
MTAVTSIRYDAPVDLCAPTDWGRDWRLRWFRSVGSVHQHWQTHQLVAFYSDTIDPTKRLALQAELEANPTGVAEVLAAHQEARDRHTRFMRGEDAI